MAALWPCPKNVPESKLESFRLILLSEEISRQPNVVTLYVVIRDQSYADLQ